MKAAKTWCVAALALVSALSSASCGKDEVAGDGTSGKGMILPEGGEGGTAGTSGRGGGTGRAGSATAGGSGGAAAAPGTKLGRACLTDNDCADTTAPGLTCVTSQDAVLGGGSPPKGLCTSPCGSDADCSSFGAGSLCFPFGSDMNAGYCVEGCTFGMPNLGEVKCHSRPEFNCNPALLGATNTACTASTDCQSGELCINGTCNVVFPACLPGCRGDIDCDAGMYCDQSFLSGVCVKDKPAGKALGEPCTLPPAGGPSEPDECIGFCQADGAMSTTGHCAATCGLGNECAYNNTTKKYDGLCLYASALTADTGASGDFGFCTPTCNCKSDCLDTGLTCSLLTQALPTDSFRGAGLCFAPDAMTKEYSQCTGTAGAGGSDTGAAGAAGAAP